MKNTTTTTTTAQKEGATMEQAIERINDMYGDYGVEIDEKIGVIFVDGGQDDETRGAEAYAHRTLKVFGAPSKVRLENGSINLISRNAQFDIVINVRPAAMVAA